MIYIVSVFGLVFRTKESHTSYSLRDIVVEKKKVRIYARYETSFDDINLQLQSVVWNAEESNSSISNFLVTTNFMYAVCGLDILSTLTQM